MSFPEWENKLEEIHDLADENGYEAIILTLDRDKKQIHLWENIRGKVWAGRSVSCEMIGQLYNAFQHEADEWSPPEIID